ncbi:MAG: bleomycin hydrolase [Bacteroidetes bacterium]|nr:MAG: bleomycin hydrolase [Bacteroidota bacterium]
MKTISLVITAAMVAVSCTGVFAQERTNKKESNYKFTVVKEINPTSIKDQFKSSTCWAFSTQSFLESEIMRMGKGQVELSEMYIVRCNYIEKAIRYMRMIGKTNFGPGGEGHDVLNCIRKYGIVPRAAYPGNLEADGKPRHGEMDDVLKSMLDAALKMPDHKLSKNWLPAFTAALDAYLGAVPEKFDYNGKSYTPKSFVQFLGINPDDYVAISSFTHHPFYQPFVLEVPDNWAWELMHNVPLNEFVQITDNAINTGYTVGWGSDVSEPTFSFKNALAIVPEKDWDKFRKGEKDSAFINPGKERAITQAYRQEAFDNLSTQDDHGMQLTGIVKDQNGQQYYIVKNSWGSEGNECGGYFYCSKSYFEYKTISILVHKNAIPKALAQKLKITP